MVVASGENPLGPRIWIVNADHWPRAYLRAELIERGYDATGFETLAAAAARLEGARALRPALLIVDLHEQAVDDGSRASLLRERVPILAVADASQADDGRMGPRVGTLHRPLTIGAIADAVDRLMLEGPPAVGT
jgi:DNA-binding response OmpR family regulator